MATKLSNICIIIVIVATVVMAGGMFTGFYVEPDSRPLVHQIVMWSFLSVVSLCGLLMLFLSLEPKPELETEGAEGEASTGDALTEDNNPESFEDDEAFEDVTLAEEA